MTGESIVSVLSFEIQVKNANTGGFFISTDGITWKKQSSDTDNWVRDILKWNGSLWASVGDSLAILSLDTVYIDMQEKDITANGMLEILIREKRITAQMATSLNE